MDTPLTRYCYSTFEAQIDKDTVESTREITFVIASEATGKDHRNGFLYNWDNWQLDNFNSSGVVLYQHQGYGQDIFQKSEPDDVIAKATAWVDTFKGKRVLMSKAAFEPKELNETADKVFRKIQFGSLRSTSVGVNPIGPVRSEVIRNDHNEVVKYLWNMSGGQDLLEWSVVHIPADPKALKRSMQSQMLRDLLSELNIDSYDSLKEYMPVNKSELSGPDPNLNKYIETLTKLKNGSLKKS